MTAWLTLIKVRYHVTFASVVCGALLFAERIDSGLAAWLLAVPPGRYGPNLAGSTIRVVPNRSS